MSTLQSICRTLNLGRLLYADKGVIVVNKASGLVCQLDKNHAKNNNGQLCDFDQLLTRIQAQLEMRISPIQIHRLDKLTSGALLLARSSNHARDFHGQFERHQVEKTYLALVRAGEKTFRKLGKHGVIEKKLRMVGEGVYVDDRGLEAVTEWEVLGSSKKAPLSLLRLRPITGRKRQIRVHLSKVLQSPILGDPLFSSTTPHESILSLLPRNGNVNPMVRETSPVDKGKILQEERLTRKERLMVEKDEKLRAAVAEKYMVAERHRQIPMFLHSAQVSLYRYTPSPSSRRLRVGVIAPLTPNFLQLCEAADLRQYLPEEYVTGGVTIDGRAVDVLEGDRPQELVDLEGQWFGDMGSETHEKSTVSQLLLSRSLVDR